MAGRVRVAVLFGGRSGEHEVSLRSAATILGGLDPARYDAIPVAVTHDGRWWTGADTLRLLDEAQRALRPIAAHGTRVTLLPEPGRDALVPVDGGAPIPIDVVFPVLHGTFGEDGTLQGLLDLAAIPYVGSGVLASSVGMDKAAMKAVFRDAGLPVCRWIVVRPEHEAAGAVAARVATELGWPCFVKPANMGSSVGVAKAHDAAALATALADAAAWDAKVLVEEAVDARELECAVLGNDAPDASVVGELIPSREFYDYRDKYVDDAARTVIPAEIPPGTAERVRRLAVRAFQAVDASGLARVDFFLDRKSGAAVLNEINTMPGFTRISMYPRLWEASGLPLPALLDRLVALARERHAARGKRRLAFSS